MKTVVRLAAARSDARARCGGGAPRALAPAWA
jgi:hypothetical protein